MDNKQQTAEEKIRGSFNLKIEGLKICAINCRHFELAKNISFPQRIVRCSNLDVCKNALTRYIGAQEVAELQKLLDGK